ncbi:MAG: hypothetical protein ACI8RN_002282, partial [Glaciecola sp.]
TQGENVERDSVGLKGMLGVPLFLHSIALT